MRGTKVIKLGKVKCSNIIWPKEVDYYTLASIKYSEVK